MKYNIQIDKIKYLSSLNDYRYKGINKHIIHYTIIYENGNIIQDEIELDGLFYKVEDFEETIKEVIEER